MLPDTRHLINIVTAVDGGSLELFWAFVLAVAHSELVYIPFPLIFLQIFATSRLT